MPISQIILAVILRDEIGRTPVGFLGEHLAEFLLEHFLVEFRVR